RFDWLQTFVDYKNNPGLLKGLFDSYDGPIQSQVSTEQTERAYEELLISQLQNSGSTLELILIQTFPKSRQFTSLHRNFIRSFVRMALRNGPPDGRAKEISDWIHGNPERALFVYENLKYFGKSHPFILGALNKSDSGFKDIISVYGVPGEVVTFSFDKETLSNLLSRYYRPKAVPENQWLALDDTTRMQKLLEANPELGRETGEIVKTSQAPIFLGALTYEKTDDGHVVLETKSRRFEITHVGVLKQIQTLAQFLGKGKLAVDAFHVHAVARLGEDIQASESFKLWYGDANRFYLYRGLEESLHPNSMTEGEDIGKWRSLGFVPGTRYGDKNLAGLELRDVTRQFPVLQDDVRKLGRAVGEKIWEIKDSDTETARLQIIRETLQGVEDVGAMHDRAMQQIPNADPSVDKFLWLVQSHYPFCLAPFLAFEDLDPKLNELEKSKIREARKTYTKNILDTKAEYERLIKNEVIPADMLVEAIQMSITEWAKTVKPSRFMIQPYRNIGKRNQKIS
ncbi:MAG: hypothetical protein K2X47_07550, partial [Bdellovibrionales bacterium]|nr:hypothetical protein [Bdellovibrionales bacterium]